MFRGGRMLIYLSMIEEENKSKFEQLYVEYRQLMFYVANKILNDEKLSEDAVHNAFLKLIDHLDKIDEIKCHKTKGFLVIIVKNISIDLFNNRKKENHISFDDIDFFIFDDQSSLEDIVITNCEYDDLIKEILELPPNYSNVLYLKYIYELNDMEISSLLSITEANVRKRIERGRKSLKLALRKEGN